jgi:hypothetical protein
MPTGEINPSNDDGMRSVEQGLATVPVASSADEARSSIPAAR